MLNRKWWIALALIPLAFITLDSRASSFLAAALQRIANAGSVLPFEPTLNFVNGGCADNPGSSRTDCTVSGSGGSGGGGITVFSGSSVTLLGTQYLAIGGGAAVSSTEATVEVESPTAAQVSNLSVQISAALGLGASAVFTWRDGGSSQTLTCRIMGSSATTCTDNTHSFNVAQGDEIDIRVVTTGTPGAVTVVVASQFGTLSNLNPTFTISNAASTGTTVNTLTKLTGAPSTAVISAVTDTGGAVGITTAGAGTTGTATITTAGKISCVFDGATTAGDYVQISSSTAGNCHDTGAAMFPTSGQVLGKVLSTNGSGGTYTLDLFPSEIQASSGGGAFTQIARTVLGSPAATVTFSSLGSYNHLQLVINARCSGAVTGDFVYLQANADSGTNYQYQYSGGIGTGNTNGQGLGTATGDIGLVTCASSVASTPGTVNFTLLDYGGTTFAKQGVGNSGQVAGSSFTGNPLFLATFYWLWNSTSAITSLSVAMSGGSNFVTGSTFTLYGLL